MTALQHPGGPAFFTCEDWSACPHLVQARAGQPCDEDMLNHLTSCVHPLLPCPHAENCAAHKRLCDGRHELKDICHHAIFTHGRPARGAWEGCVCLSGSDRIKCTAGQKTLCWDSTEMDGFEAETVELQIADVLDAEGTALVSEELRTHGLAFEIHLLDTVVPRLRRNPRLQQAVAADPWYVNAYPEDAYSVDGTLHLEVFRKLKSRPLTDVELLACLLYTGTEVQGSLRKALRKPDRQNQDAASWKWTILALRHAIIKLAEPPPEFLYHGLNGVKRPRRRDMYDAADEYDMCTPHATPHVTSVTYSNFISGSMHLDMARVYALGESGTVTDPRNGGTVLHFDLKSRSGRQSWHENGLIVADMRWISKFPDEMEWLMMPTQTGLSLYLSKHSTERTPIGELLHIPCEWFDVSGDTHNFPAEVLDRQKPRQQRYTREEPGLYDLCTVS